jgi:hypothetical protein
MIKQQDIFKKIGAILKELNDQYDYLSENENDINDLELELFVANANFLTDHAEVLRKVNMNKPEVPKPAPVSEPRFFEPVVQQVSPPRKDIVPAKEIKPEQIVKPADFQQQVNIEQTPVPHIDLRGDDTGTDYSFIRQEPEVIRHELSVDEVPDRQRDYDKPVHETVKEQPKPEAAKTEPDIPAKTEAKTADTKEDEPLTINQRISAQLKSNNNKAEEPKNAQPVADLKQAITLNDKLLYIKDLFNGYNLAYAEAIDILNRFNTFDEADDFLKTNYAAKNNWVSRQATVDKLYALLRRRYS